MSNQKTKPKRELRPLADGKNPNKHNAYGLGLLEDAMQRQGYVAPMTAAASGEVLDGNARLEKAATVFAGVEPLIIEHDGTRPIVMVRTDIPDANHPRAKDIIVTANRIGEADLEWDVDVLKNLQAEGVDLSVLWGDNQLAQLLQRDDPPTDPNEHWQGMPECSNQDLTPWKSLTVHFASAENYQKFVALMGQPMTENTKSVWYPEGEKISVKKIRYVEDETADAKS
jgi:hypothetical protein